jgi:hypothetical protein
MKRFVLAGLMVFVEALMKKVIAIGLHRENQQATGAQSTSKKLKNLPNLD